MGRIGVTFEVVDQAASKLVEEGKNPTVDGVREHLGTGSKSTIAPLLRRWKEEQQSLVIPQQRRLTLPERLSVTVSDLYNQLQQKAEETIEAVKEQFSQERAKLKQENEALAAKGTQMEQLYLNAQSQYNQQQNQLDRLREQHSINLEESRTLRTKLSATEQWLAEKQEELKEQRRVINRTQENLIHYQERVQQKREQERAKYEAELGRVKGIMHEIQSELQQIQNENQALSDRIEHTYRENELLKHQIGEKDYEVEKVTAHLTDLKSANKQLEGQIFVTKQQLDTQVAESKKDRDERASLDRRLAISEHLTSTIQTENKKLKERVESLEAERIKLLTRLTDRSKKSRE